MLPMQAQHRPASTPPHLRGLLAHMALALLFLLAQHHAGKHWLAHAVESVLHHDASAPTPSPCSDCDGVAAFGAALPTPEAAPPVRLDLVQADAVAGATAWLMAADAAVYESRAPPAMA